MYRPPSTGRGLAARWRNQRRISWAAIGLRADSARPQRVSGSARTDSRRAESARNPIAAHIKFGDDSALNALTRGQWTAALRWRRSRQDRVEPGWTGPAG